MWAVWAEATVKVACCPRVLAGRCVGGFSWAKALATMTPLSVALVRASCSPTLSFVGESPVHLGPTTVASLASLPS
jgi:hypothetical protein